MRLRVMIDGRPFDVEVLDPRARPVVAVVEGERFEVWPEETDDHGAGTTDHGPRTSDQGPRTKDQGTIAEQERAPAATGTASPLVLRPSSSDTVLAPIPGVIVLVSAQAGQRVAAGQELLVLEAMKMQNSIRAPRDGVVAAVRVTAGQHVRHREPLLEYEP